MRADTLFIDIETIPAQRPDIIAHIEESLRDEMKLALDGVRAPANYKDQIKIDEYVVEKRASIKSEFDAKLSDKISATGLDGAFGQIVAIGWAFGDDPANCLVAKGLDGSHEAALLGAFFSYMPTRFESLGVIVGHNLAAFDLRFIKQRAMVNGVKPPRCIPFDAKPWDSVIYDTMIQFAGVGGRISLNKLALAFGIPGKQDGLTGADVWPMVQRGEFDKLADYCKADVELTRAIYRRMTFLA